MKLFTALLLLCTLVFSQKDQFGLFAGTNYNSFKMDSSGKDGLENRWDFDLGLNYNMENLLLSASYERKSHQFKNGDNYKTYTYLTLSPKYKFGLQNVYLFAGPAIGFRLSATETSDGKTKDIADPDKKLKDIRYSIIAGAAMHFDNLQLTASYDYGLSDVSDIEVNDKHISNKFHSFKLGVGFLF